MEVSLEFIVTKRIERGPFDFSRQRRRRMNRFSNVAVGIALRHSLCIEMLSEKRQIARIVVLPEPVKSFFMHNLNHRIKADLIIIYIRKLQSTERREGNDIFAYFNLFK